MGEQVVAEGDTVEVGALIARIGGGEPFRVGENASLAASADGELFLCVNDRSTDDNTGHYTVRVQVG